jgi:hypothetical protein
VALTPQPSGPTAETANVWSSAVSLLRVRLKVKVVPAVP